MPSVTELIVKHKNIATELKRNLDHELAVIAELESVSPARAERGNGSSVPTFAIVRDILTKAGHPIHIKEIAERLKQNGYATGAKLGMYTVVSNCITNHKAHFHRVAPGVYELAVKGEPQ